MSTSNSLAGGWSTWSFDLDAAAKAAFASINFPIGVNYSNPQAVATQVVNGTNYAFICQASPVTADPVSYPVLVHAYMAAGATKAEFQNVEPLGPQPSSLMGGWSSWHFPASADATKVLAQAQQIGMTYTALADTAQVVAGLNYCFLAKGTIATLGNPQVAALVYAYAPPSGQPHITHAPIIKPS